jgi:hypothetical protein
MALFEPSVAALSTKKARMSGSPLAPVAEAAARREGLDRSARDSLSPSGQQRRMAKAASFPTSG